VPARRRPPRRSPWRSVILPPMHLQGETLSASLTVKDLEASRGWYCDVVGFDVDQRYEREGKLLAISLRAGNARLLITQDDGAKGWDRVKGEGISLMIVTNQNVDELAQSIKDAGGTLDTEPADMGWNMRAFRLHDPDGFRLTVASIRSA